MHKSMDDLMVSLSGYHDLMDEVMRNAHSTWMSYDPLVRVEHDARAQAACIYSHAVAAADRRFLDDNNIIHKEIKNLKVWIFKKEDVVVRFKKMDENGESQNCRTKQQHEYDAGKELPGLPYPPTRLTVGYLLDETGTQFKRTQIAQPMARSILWCAAIVPYEDRAVGDAAWIDVTRQSRAV